MNTPMRGPSPEASGHTPGPWLQSSSNIFTVYSEHDDHIAQCSHSADARLIAAAPELLEALRAILATSDLNFDSLEPDTVRAIQAARAVMEKVQT